MRILHLNTLYPPNTPGGAERFVAVLAQEQAKRGHEVAVATLSREVAPASKEDGVVVHRIGYGNFYWFEDWKAYPAPIRYAHKFLGNWNPILLRRVRHIVEDFQPDVMNTHCMLSFGVDSWRAAAERDIPIVHALHEFNLICRNTNAFRNGHMCETVCALCRINDPKRLLSRYVSSVVGVSSDVLNRHLQFGLFKHVPESRRTVIWSMPRLAIRSRPERAPDSPFTIGFIGRIVPEKGLETLLAAISALPREGWRLLIAGKVFPPLDLATLQAGVRGLPVEWLNVVPADDFYKQVDLLVVPAMWADPGPLVVHEAFANAVPVVGARMGGITDFIEEGVTGWLYKPGDVNALADILRERLRIGRPGLPPESAFSRFRLETTPQRVAERYEDVYRAVIDDFKGKRLNGRP
jgi:glycosyltransferase involved in cell wall biosynthesis